MGMDPDGILTYGYDLGGPETGWKVEGLGKYGELITPWYRREADDYESDEERDEDFGTTADEALLVAHGFTEEWTPLASGTGYYDRKHAAENAIGVEVKTCGGSDYPSYLLVTYWQSVEWSETAIIDWQALETRRAVEGWDLKLSGALHHLGLKPTQEGPRWLLAAAYG